MSNTRIKHTQPLMVWIHPEMEAALAREIDRLGLGNKSALVRMALTKFLKDSKVKGTRAANQEA